MEATVQVVSKIHTRFIPQTERWKVEALIYMVYNFTCLHTTRLFSVPNTMVTVLGKPVLTPHTHSSDVSKLIQLFHLNPIFDMDTNAGARSQLHCVCIVCTIKPV